MPSICLSEARNTLSALITRVEAGDEVEITRRGKTVARVVPPRIEAPPSQAARVKAAFRRIHEITQQAKMDDIRPETLKASYRQGLM
jgi:prevent-host-death family protein